jgi:hypothetical protein
MPNQIYDYGVLVGAAWESRSGAELTATKINQVRSGRADLKEGWFGEIWPGKDYGIENDDSVCLDINETKRANFGTLSDFWIEVIRLGRYVVVGWHGDDWGDSLVCGYDDVEQAKAIFAQAQVHIQAVLSSFTALNHLLPNPPEGS